MFGRRIGYGNRNFEQRETEEELWCRSKLPKGLATNLSVRTKHWSQSALTDSAKSSYCKFDHEELCRPSQAPGLYFRLMMRLETRKSDRLRSEDMVTCVSSKYSP